jgi:hypothetical protein
MLEIKGYLPNNRWLQGKNRYRVDAIEKIKADLNATGVREPHLRAYIAASAPLHVADAWAYLSRSLYAHLAGERYTSLHLGYYAELRAALSLLAVGGVGIFNSQHFAVTDTGCVRLGNMPTHEMVWEALQAWSATPEAAAICGAAIRPGGIAISDWLNSPTLGLAWGSTLSQWLQRWGIDLLRFAPDRDTRNLVSYRPTAFHGARNAPADQVMTSAMQLWRALEPSAESPYTGLDFELLRRSLRSGLQVAKAAGWSGSWRDYATSAVTSASPPPGTESTWIRRLVAADPAARYVLDTALRPAVPTQELPNLPVIARALLLTRVASGASRNLMQTASITQSDLAFWWGPAGAIQGFWPTGSPPSPLADLWADVELALDEVSSAGTLSDLWSWKLVVGNSIDVLGQADRAMMWGLIPA